MLETRPVSFLVFDVTLVNKFRHELCRLDLLLSFLLRIDIRSPMLVGDVDEGPNHLQDDY